MVRRSVAKPSGICPQHLVECRLGLAQKCAWREQFGHGAARSLETAKRGMTQHGLYPAKVLGFSG
jgi:hypothetical protein